MITTCVHIQVKPEHIEEFKQATLANHFASVQEPGNLRFDVLQDPADPSRFMLYEAYVSEDAAAAHKLTAHYATWRDTVASWMASPRQGIKYTFVSPVNP